MVSDKTQTFLTYFKPQKEAGLIIAKDSAALLDSEKVLQASGFKEARMALEALESLGKGGSTYIILRAPLSKDFYDLIVQYTARGGMIQIMDKATMEFKSVQFDPLVSHLVLLTLKESLEDIEKQFLIRDKVGMTELLGRIGEDNKITIPQESYITQGEFLSAEEVANIPGIKEVMIKYIEVSEALQKEVKNRTTSRGVSQPVVFATPRDDKRIFEFVQHFYHGDISKTFQDAFRYYYMNKVLDDGDRAKISSLIEQLKYVQPANTSRQSPRPPT